MTVYNELQFLWLLFSIFFCVVVAIIRNNNDYAAIIFKMTSVLFLPIILLLTFSFCIAKIIFGRTTLKKYLIEYLRPFIKKLFL